MIKNVLAAVLSCFAAIGCHKDASVPEGFQGLVEYDERIIGFEEPGRVALVPVHRGEAVQVGDTLATLDDALVRATRDARTAELAAARADLALLRAGTRREDIAGAVSDVAAAVANELLLAKSAARAHRLFDDGAIPKAEVDRADGELEQSTSHRKSLEARLASLRRGARPEEIARAEAIVEQRASNLELENARLARMVLRASGTGAILDVEVKAGEIAAAGTPAVTLADTDHPYADVFVPEGGLGGVRTGALALVRVDASSEVFHGQVEHVSPMTEFTPKFLFSDRERPNLVIRVRVRIDDPSHRMHSGVPAFVRFEP